MKKRIDVYFNYSFYCLLVLFITNPISSFSQDGMIAFEELLKEKIYKNDVYNDDKDFIDINTYHPEVYRIQISADTDIYEFASKSTNFPNLQELIINGHFMSFPVGISQFKKLQILKISFCQDDRCQRHNVISLFDELFELRNLKVLHFSGASCLYYIPEKIAQLDQLMVFENVSYFGGPVILPISFAYLPKLQYLGLIDRASLESNFFYCNVKNISFKEDEDFIKSTHKGYWKSCMPFHYDSYIDDLKTINNLKTIDKKISHRYPNGKISIKGQLSSKNLPDGHWTFYHQNGFVKEDRFYKNGKEIGMWAVYDSLGSKLINYHFPNDSVLNITTYHPTYGKIAEMSFLNHKADGIWRTFIFLEGKIYLESERRYLNDKLNGLSTEIEYTFNNEDSCFVESVYKTNYLNGKKHGDEIREDRNGNIIQIDHYINGVIQLK